MIRISRRRCHETSRCLSPLRVPQSVRLLTALVHDTSLPDKIRQGAARLLIPSHLQLERDRLLRERAMARTGTLRKCEHEREVIGWT